MSGSDVRHLILIGLPGAGKSTAGRLLADRLGTHWTDIDPIIERATGLSIAELFALEGEEAFRGRERLAVEQALRLPPHVVTPGGGWAAQPGNLDDAAAACLVHLAIAPEAAARRLAGDASRPLLQGQPSPAADPAAALARHSGALGGRDPTAGPVARLNELAAARLPFYRRAEAEVEVSGKSSEEVADLLLEIARRQAGWPA
ncbi:MAG: shikimate kinase [Vicinamibacterales bacterium]